LKRSDIVRAVNVKGTVDVLGRGDDVELENVAGNVTINGYYSGDITCRNLAKPVLFQSGTTELRIERLPGQFDLTLGDFTGKNLVGPIRMTARTKDVQIQDFQGEVSISVERGDVPSHRTARPRRKSTLRRGAAMWNSRCPRMPVLRSPRPRAGDRATTSFPGWLSLQKGREQS